MPLLALTGLVAVYLHRLDPVALQLGPLAIRWYGLSYLLGFVVGYLLVRRVTKVGVTTLKPLEAGDFVFAVVVGVLVGGRLGYVLFYKPSLLWTFSDGFPWWDALAINKGGMASHGGIAGTILAVGWYARKHKHAWPHLLDILAFGAAPGLFFGRIANFINGELYGRPVEAGSVAMKWAVRFPQEMYEWNPEVAADAVRIDALAAALPHLPEVQKGVVFERLSDQVHAVVTAVQHGNPRVSAVVEPLLTPRHPSQLYEAALEGLVLWVVLMIVWVKPRKPLVLGAAFGITYSLGRIISEFFRLPDEHIRHQEAELLGVTRGQWLSVILLLVGVVLLAIFARRDAPRMGGWRRSAGESAPPSPGGA